MRVRARKMERIEGFGIAVPLVCVYDNPDDQPVPEGAEQVPDTTPLSAWVRED
jgi:hypothetical protein